MDDELLESLAAECPRIIVNPGSSHLGYRGLAVPREALPDITIDDPVVKDLDPRIWAVPGFRVRVVSSGDQCPSQVHIAERFRLAFEERDARLAPKRAKNARQRQRRAQREWMRFNTAAKASLVASQVCKSVHKRNK